MSKLFLTLGLLFVLSCGGLHHQSDTSSKSETEPKNELLFLLFKISKAPNDLESKVILLQKTKSEGKMKNELENTPTSPNYLTIVFYENATPRKTLLLPHPLYKQVEYLNDNKQYSTKEIELKEDTFFIRFPFDPKIRKITIFETLRNTPIKKLFTLNL